MSLVDNIEAIITSKGLTFKRLERECGLGNGTIKRWENQSPRLDGLIKVSKYLQTPLDALVFGSSATEIDCDRIPLSEIESDLVAMYRLIDKPDQQTIFELTQLKYQLKVGEKASSFSMYPDVIERQKSGSDRDDKSTRGTA
jgi:transcriptional regulator with XRE-family HTH domain